MSKVDEQVRKVTEQITSHPAWVMLSIINRRALLNYVLYGNSVDGFVKEVIVDSLLGAVTKASVSDINCLHCWGAVMRESVPMACRGSHMAMDSWIKDGGLVGVAKKLTGEE